MHLHDTESVTLDHSVAAQAFSSLGMSSFEASLLINKSQKAFNSLLKTCLGHHGLTIPTWSLLGCLYHHKSATPGEVATFMGVKAPFASTLVNTLVKDGFVSVQVYEDDERSRLLSLTKAGKAKVEHVEPLLHDCLNGQFQHLGMQNLQDYFATASYMVDNVKHH